STPVATPIREPSVEGQRVLASLGGELIRRREDEHAARAQSRRHVGETRPPVLDVLEHVVGDDDVEAVGIGDTVLDVSQTEVEAHAGSCCPLAGELDQLEADLQPDTVKSMFSTQPQETTGADAKLQQPDLPRDQTETSRKLQKPSNREVVGPQGTLSLSLEVAADAAERRLMDLHDRLSGGGRARGPAPAPDHAAVTSLRRPAGNRFRRRASQPPWSKIPR